MRTRKHRKLIKMNGDVGLHPFRIGVPGGTTYVPAPAPTLTTAPAPVDTASKPAAPKQTAKKMPVWKKALAIAGGLYGGGLAIGLGAMAHDRYKQHQQNLINDAYDEQMAEAYKNYLKSRPAAAQPTPEYFDDVRDISVLEG